MRIALVSPYDYAYPGGVTQHVCHLALEFDRAGHETHLIGPCSARDIEAPVPFHRVSTPVSLPMNGSVARIGLTPRLSQDVKEILSSGTFDVVHLHEPFLPMLPLAVLRASRTTNVGTFHAFRPHAFAYLYAKPFLRYFTTKLHGRIAVSSSARDYAAAHLRGDYQIIPNGIDYAHFSQPVEPPADLRDERPNVLFVGRLEKRKGLSYLLRAWTNVRAAVPDARLVVVGGGGGLDHYRQFVQARSDGDIVFTGSVSDDDLVRYYHAADVFCAPSTGQESFGIVLLEAMAAGAPIVATDIAGYRDVVTHEHDGLLVPSKKPDHLAAALITLLRSSELRIRLAQQGRTTALRYTWDRVAGEVLDFYEETIHRRALLKRLRGPRFRRVRKVASAAAHILPH